MALLNPVYAFIVPFLFVVTIPLSVFAGITTTLACSVLFFRVIVVYLDVAWSLVPQALIGLKSRRPAPLNQSSLLVGSNGNGDGANFLYHTHASIASGPPTPLLRKRRRRPSSVSIVSAGSATPISDAGLGLIPSVGPERDFEGVGGWRTGDDDIWTGINSRLELPDRQYVRNHHRSPSGGPTTPGEGGFLMMKSRNRSSDKVAKPCASPNSSRARTPSGPRISFGGVGYSDSYFPMTLSPKTAKKASLHTGS